MTLGHQKSKVTDFCKKCINPDSSPFCSLHIDAQFTIQTSKLFMFDSILANRQQSPKCLLNTIEGNSFYFTLTNFHAWKLKIKQPALHSRNTGSVGKVVNLKSVCREQNRLLSGPTFFLKKRSLWISYVPNSCGLIFERYLYPNAC